MLKANKAPVTYIFDVMVQILEHRKIQMVGDYRNCNIYRMLKPNMNNTCQAVDLPFVGSPQDGIYSEERADRTESRF
jgi:hypothetical protein